MDEVYIGDSRRDEPVDVSTELPIAYETTYTSNGDIPIHPISLEANSEL